LLLPSTIGRGVELKDEMQKKKKKKKDEKDFDFVTAGSYNARDNSHIGAILTAVQL
jgi:hypothetical protein